MTAVCDPTKGSSISRRLEFACESLETRRLLTANILFDIADGGDLPLPDFDAAAYADYVRSFASHEHHDSDGDHLMEPFLLDPFSTASADSSPGDGALWDNYDLTQTFALNSLASADHTIFLDFDGHTTTGTLWNSNYNSNNPINTPAYNFTGTAGSFADSELARIQRIWARVAEDFAPFHVNVTTQDPGSDALRRSGAGDTQWGVRVVVGANTFYSSAGGVAYVGSFDWTTDTPAFVFNTSELGVSEAASHEAGHALGLRHDGRSGEEYYSGHGSGATSWAPIMGVSYSRAVSQWSQGEYADASRQEDDLAIIATQNGFGYRVDDYANAQSGATALLPLGGTDFNTTFGIIEQNSDVDFFSFQASAGAATIAVDPLSFGANLDVLATLYDASGALIASSNPLDALDASFTLDLPGDGLYYLSVTGVGVGDPQGTGYSDYGSLGNYRITGSVQPVDTNVTTTIEVRASGDEGTETFDLLIDGQRFQSFAVDTEFHTYTYTAVGEVTADQIRVAFHGDTNEPNGDVNTNLNVDWIQVGGSRYQTDDVNVFSTAVGPQGSIRAGLGLGETLSTDGYFQFYAGANPRGVRVESLDGVRVTRRVITVSLDTDDAPLTIDLGTGTLSTGDGYIDIPDTIRRINTIGNGSDDVVFIVGTEGSDVSYARRNFLRFRGGNTTVIGRKMETVHMYGMGGDDRATLRGRRQSSERIDANSDRTLASSSEFAFAVYNTELVRPLGFGPAGQNAASAATPSNAAVPRLELADGTLGYDRTILFAAAGGFRPAFASSNIGLPDASDVKDEIATT